MARYEDKHDKYLHVRVLKHRKKSIYEPNHEKSRRRALSQDKELKSRRSLGAQDMCVCVDTLSGMALYSLRMKA
jgi:hypothetical protein